MSPIFILGLALSAVIGLSLGLIGGGGSILTVPILVYFLGVTPHEAITMSLAVVGATSLFGSFLHYRQANVDVRTGLLFGSAGIVGAFVGSPLTKLVSPEVLLMIFGMMMFIVAIAMIWRRQHRLEEGEDLPHYAKGLLAGFGVGVLTGFLGVGGGFLIVPAMVLFGGVTMKKAIGTSLFVIFLNCVAGLIGHLGDGSLDWFLATMVTGLAVSGAAVGTVLSHRIAPHRLQSMFAVLVLCIGAFLVVKNYSMLF